MEASGKLAAPCMAELCDLVDLVGGEVAIEVVHDGEPGEPIDLPNARLMLCVYTRKPDDAFSRDCLPNESWERCAKILLKALLDDKILPRLG